VAPSIRNLTCSTAPALSRFNRSQTSHRNGSGGSSAAHVTDERLVFPAASVASTVNVHAPAASTVNDSPLATGPAQAATPEPASSQA